MAPQRRPHLVEPVRVAGEVVEAHRVPDRHELLPELLLGGLRVPRAPLVEGEARRHLDARVPHALPLVLGVLLPLDHLLVLGVHLGLVQHLAKRPRLDQRERRAVADVDDHVLAVGELVADARVAVEDLARRRAHALWRELLREGRRVRVGLDDVPLHREHAEPEDALLALGHLDRQHLLAQVDVEEQPLRRRLLLRLPARRRYCRRQRGGRRLVGRRRARRRRRWPRHALRKPEVERRRHCDAVAGVRLANAVGGGWALLLGPHGWSADSLRNSSTL